MPKGEVVVDSERCKGCGLCINACPKEVLKYSAELNSNGYNYISVERPQDCIACGFCGRVCPDVALTVFKVQTEGA